MIRRGSKGWSAREMLETQGVTDERAMRHHMGIMHSTLLVQPLIDLTRYRVNPSNPNCLGVYSA